MAKHKLAYAGVAAALTFGMGVFVPRMAYADYDLAACLSGNATKTCTLTSDVELDSLITLTSDATIDLAGHNITSSSTAKFFEVKGHSLTITGEGELSTTDATNTGIIRVFGTDDASSEEHTAVTIDKEVALSGPNPIVIYANKGTAYNTTVDIYGTLSGHNSGIWLIGTVADKENYPTINIYDDAVVAADGAITEVDEGGIALSAMGYGQWNIGKASISGVGSGIGIKGGIVTIDGAAVLATGDPSVLPPELYNNGMNPSGSAIQIEKNSGYLGGIELSIASGTFSSAHKDAIIEYGEADSVKSIEIVGGTFSSEPAVEYIADGYVAAEDGDNYKVAPLVTEITLGHGEENIEMISNESTALRISYKPESAAAEFSVSTDKPELFENDSPKIIYDNGTPGLVLTAADAGTGEATVIVTEKYSGKTASVKVKVTEVLTNDSAIADDGTTAFVYFESPIEGENLALEVTNEELTEEEKTNISPFLKEVYDISVVNQATDEVVSVSDNRIDVMLILNAENYVGMNYFKVGYINDEGKLAEVFDTEVRRDEESETIALFFTTTHLSSYGVLASETEFPETLTPDTGAFTGSASMHGDYRGLVATVVAMIVMTIVMEVVMYRKNHAKNVK